MKLRFYISILLTIFFMTGCSTKGYTIVGVAPDGTKKVVLSKLIGKNPVPIDTAAVESDGEFEIKGSIETPMMAYLSVFEDDNVFAQLFLTDEKFRVLHESGTSEFFVVGGSENENYRKFLNDYEKVEEKYSGDNEKLYNFFDSIINVNPSSFAVSYYLFRYMYNVFPINQTEKLASKFTSEVQSGIYLKMLSVLISQNRLTQPGNKYINFTSKTPAGDSMSLSSVIDGKSWVLLNFWASWCPYCRKENPELVNIYSRYHDYGLKILSVSLDYKNEKWVEAIKHDGLVWDNVSNLDRWDCDAARIYGISGIPGNILISPDGVIISRNLHGDSLDNLLKSQFEL